jgi:hypothetical protein
VDPHPKCILQLGYSSKNSQEELLPTPWNKTWTGCASALLLLLPTQVYLVLLLPMGIQMKSTAERRQRQHQLLLQLVPQ